MQYVRVKNAKKGKNHFNADTEWNLNVANL